MAFEDLKMKARLAGAKVDDSRPTRHDPSEDSYGKLLEEKANWKAMEEEFAEREKQSLNKPL